MKKILWILLLLPSIGYCDTKISGMTTTSAMGTSDIIPIVVNPNTNAQNRSITLNNFTNSITSATISNVSGLPLKLDQPTIGSNLFQGISFSQQGAQSGYFRQDDYLVTCSDISTTCQNAFEIGWSTSSFFFNRNGTFFASQGPLRQNAYSSVIGGSLIVGGTGNYNYADTQQIGDGNLFVNNGIITSTMTVNGTGNGQITLVIAGSTYTVTSASAAFSPGQFAVFSSTSGTMVGSSLGLSVNSASNYAVAHYNSSSSTSSLAGSSSLTYDGLTLENDTQSLFNSTFTLANIASFAFTNVSSAVITGVYWDLTGSTQTATSVIATGSIQLPSKTLAQLGALIPGALGQMYYCSNCATDAICVSTQTATASWARDSSKGTLCQ